jgi:chemotaxis protein methyltransferase CheR
MTRSPGRDLLLKYRNLVYGRYGIHYSEDKTEVLRMKLEKLMYAQDLDLEEYYARLESGDPEAEDILLRAITVGHTFFFREGDHFKNLVDDIRSRGIQRPFIWCAASSTGEEPYSIVITLLEHGLSDFRVICSDVNAAVLHFMNHGEYAASRLQEVPDALIKRYFLHLNNDTYRIREKLRSYLLIKRLNLHYPIEFEHQFDYIFCRNVMIYFDDTARVRAVQNLVRNLKPNGLLFVGHTEAILALPSNMKRDGAACFRRTS